MRKDQQRKQLSHQWYMSSRPRNVLCSRYLLTRVRPDSTAAYGIVRLGDWVRRIKARRSSTGEGRYCRRKCPLQEGSDSSTGHNTETHGGHGGERNTSTLRAATARGGAAGLGGGRGSLGGGGRLSLRGGGLGLYSREGRSRSAGADDCARSTSRKRALRGGDNRLRGHSSGGSLAPCQQWRWLVRVIEVCLPQQPRTAQRRERRKQAGR
ncbi:uncharacterized protein BP01DRAFT_82023 [Aspergillus saccharolyticus JOP 1030-1]|uniref:Uncharacterized protein n=1 Tax=Aspergillus saccharolyticus JOP 1030-1 TaxID=1450539 RepID=A0A318ZAS2_9EURO|nr:hypothetical protein BP01DRAFT_82023 [Aspergillus saccharolyticus JOP 1030-1]PYH44389.1 hypothetical protein BP01DRAFT_82023 [Aspergillus saccharolyticus JOP 1030-1]